MMHMAEHREEPDYACLPSSPGDDVGSPGNNRCEVGKTFADPHGTVCPETKEFKIRYFREHPLAMADSVIALNADNREQLGMFVKKKQFVEKFHGTSAAAHFMAMEVDPAIFHDVKRELNEAGVKLVVLQVSV